MKEVAVGDGIIRKTLCAVYAATQTAENIEKYLLVFLHTTTVSRSQHLILKECLFSSVENREMVLLPTNYREWEQKNERNGAELSDEIQF